MRRGGTRILCGGLALALVLGVGTLSAERGAEAQEPAGPSRTEFEIGNLLDQQIAALNAESADAVMLCFHPDAPDREGMRQVMVNQFRVRDLRYSVTKRHFVAEDGRYAYLRTWQRVDGTNEETPFIGETEELLVFRLDKRSQWKAWTSARLDKRRVPLPGEKGTKGPLDDR